MTQYGWSNCPAIVREAVEGFVGEVEAVLGANLLGVYLHGSSAMDCFNPNRSDIDLLVITGEGMDLATKRRIAELLLGCSNAPRPIEISFVRRVNLQPWQYPTPFDFHYSEDWRAQIGADIANGSWTRWNDESRRDPDLAAHLTITIQRGIALTGPAPHEMFQPVPPNDYLDAIWGDVNEVAQWINTNVVYGTLNLCRVYAYVRDGFICSKDEGGTWALSIVSPMYRDLVEQTLEAYRGERSDQDIERQYAAAFAQDILNEIERRRR